MVRNSSRVPTKQMAEQLSRKIIRELGIRPGESLKNFAERTHQVIGNQFSNALAMKLQDAYKMAIKDVVRETGGGLGILEFGPVDRKHVESILDSEMYGKVLNGYNDYAVGKIKETIMRATQQRTSYSDIASDLEEEIGVIHSRGMLIARNEMGNVYNTARGVQFRKVDPDGTKYVYDWIGPNTRTTTEICHAIETKASKGLTHDELLDLIEEVSTGPLGMKGFTYTRERPYQSHFNERHKPRMRMRA